MARPYKGHLLTEEQKKIAEENVNFVWYYYGKNISKRSKHLSETDKDELISSLYFGLCLASEKYDPEKGKFATIANWYLRSEVSNYFRERKLFYGRYSIIPFIFDDNLNDDFDEMHDCPEEKYKMIKAGMAVDRVDPKFFNGIKWDKIEYITKNSNFDSREEMIFNFHFKNKYSFPEISDMMNLSRERVRQISESAIRKIKDFVSLHNIKKEDIIWD